MIIIIEGINGTGKTTLAKNISLSLGIPIYKTLGQDREFIPAYNKDYFMLSWRKGIIDYIIGDFIRQVDCDVIFDRSLFSLFPYSKDDDDDKLLNYVVAWWNMIQARVTNIFYLYTRDYDIVSQRSKDKIIHVGLQNDLKKIQERYEIQWNKINFKKLNKICVDNMSQDEIWNIVRKEVKC